ncbi:hypothetical protein PPYR_12479 [Photinus pyralis]|uniref:Glucuronosyltransferase n=1 Tax=Photinus pyralis TaxID=7054 RepID=A0A5N4AE89_PHOPY|nr:hypothetical protein PPYR_12479 [Photinus pyralis]
MFCGNGTRNPCLINQETSAHPNVKLFVTHGGLLSITEAVYHGVPIVGIPVYGDQHSNMKIAEDNGYGIAVPFKHLTQKILSSAIEKVLSNHKFVESARRRSKALRDNPLDPLDKAIYGIEYVLRHNGAPHLRSSALQLNWFQYFLLDVIAAMAVLVTIVICSCGYCIRKKPNKKQKIK